MKRGQELRVEELSVQNLRESHETIQRLTSQMQEMRGQMNSTSDSGEFQEVESDHRARLSYGPSQSVTLPSHRSMLSRDKRLPFGTWNASGPLNFLRLLRPDIIITEFIILRHRIGYTETCGWTADIGTAI